MRKLYGAPYWGLVEPHPPSLSTTLGLMLEGLLGMPRAVYLLVSLWLRQRRPHRRAISALRRAVAAPETGLDPLMPLESGLYEVSAEFLGSSRAPATPTVLHFLGTGENVYSPLTGLAAMCRAHPALATCRHVVADTPADPAGFLGPDEFATRLRRAIEPELARNRDQLVLVGLSRGAVAALHLATHLAEGHGTRVGVLAMSPPLAMGEWRPPSVTTIGALEPSTDNLVRQIQAMPWIAPLAERFMRQLYVGISAFVLAELRMASDAAIALYARYVRNSDPKHACLRAVREFALLGRISAAELRHALSGVAQGLARSPGVRAIVCWGSDDAWLPVQACMDRVERALAQHGVPGDRASVHLLRGWNHGVGREPERDFEPLAALLWELCEHAVATLPEGAMDGTRR